MDDTFRCGHPKAPENLVSAGREKSPRCKTCKNQRLRNQMPSYKRGGETPHSDDMHRASMAAGSAKLLAGIVTLLRERDRTNV